jgi:hypothetical protein
MQVTLNKLGKVPSAKNADVAGTALVANSAATAGSAASATNATNATVAQSAVNAQNAAQAQLASTLSNLEKINWRVPANTPNQKIYGSPGNKLTVSAACGSGGSTLTLKTGVDHAVIQSIGTGGFATGGTDLQVDDFMVSGPQTLSNGSEQRTLVYTEPGGQTVILTYAIDNSPGMPGVGCLLNGSAFAMS